MARVGLVSLGCPKNLVDSEGALGEIVEAGHEIVTDISCADVIVVNTCGFIESARAESIEAVNEALEYKKSGSCKAVIVIGCLSQRFPLDQDVDVLLGIGHSGKIGNAISRALAGERIHDPSLGSDLESRPNEEQQWVEQIAHVQATPPWTAYVKISDGCSNRCAYCAIPDIRGPYRSRPENLILDEAKRFADAGVREIVLIGQDLTQYGEDLAQHDVSLAGLIKKLNEIDGLRWIRMMYCYPTKVTQELIDVIAGCEKVVKYMDLPLQHGDDGILKAMNRRGSVSDYEQLIERFRAKCPEIALRTTFIVGFPGETEEAFENLLEFVERIRFDRVGAFVYSLEEGTPAAKLGKRVPQEIAEARLDRLMLLQQKISLERNQSFIGKTMEVLVEGVERLESWNVGRLESIIPALEHSNVRNLKTLVYGRSYRDAPEIDGLVYLPGSTAKPGEFVEATIAEATEYDLIGSKVRMLKG